MSQLPFPFGGGLHFQPTHNHNQNTPANMPAANPAVHSNIPQTQQAAFMQNAQLPGIDMATVLQGITPEQLAYIGQLYQSGQIPLPPAQAMPATNAQPAIQQNGNGSSVSRQEMDPTAVDVGSMEREAGEVTPQKEPDFLHPPPTGPKKRSGSIHMRPDHNSVDKRAKRQPSPPRQPQGYDRRRPEPRTDAQTSPPRSQVRQRKAKQDAAKKFILAMYSAGIAFDDIAREVGDARMLRVLFRELGLNTPSEKPKPIPAPASVYARSHEQNASANAAAIPTQGSPLNAAVAKPAVKPIHKPIAITKAPATADRSAYLAKLQAAKNKKNEALLANANPPPVVAPATSQTAPAQQPSVVDVPMPSQLVVQQPKKAKVQTELIRKRLEAFKSEQARKQEAERLANASPMLESNAIPVAHSVDLSVAQTPSRSMNATPQEAEPVFSAAIQQSRIPAPTQPAATPAQVFDFTSQFPGLPGLFMTGTPTQVPAVPQVSTTTSASSNHVTAPVETAAAVHSSSDHTTSNGSSPIPEAEAELPMYKNSNSTKQSAASSGQATPKHPFNQNRYDSNDDSVIIHVSDEEESELDDVEEEEVAPPPAPKPATTKPGPLRNFPVQNLSAPTSAPTTPGATTPGGSAYERKLQEINEMHRRIAEMQKQPRKAKAKPASPIVPGSTPAAPTTSSTSTLPGLASAVVSAPTSVNVASQPVEQPLVLSQQMEAKLAQLEEEAEVISEQTQAASQTTQPALAQQTEIISAPEAESTTSSDDDDDDDAMDLSSGEDRDSDEDEEVNENDAPEAAVDEDFDITTIPAGMCANKLAMMSDSSSDSDDSSTDSEDEESEDDYEPAPAVPHVDASHPSSFAADQLAQDQALLSSAAASETVSSTPVPQFTTTPQDLDLAPELQPSASEQARSVVTPEATSKPYYKPYESPLRMFRDYRFHPQFTSDVQGGFKSLTYSNKLDPTEAMCPNELSSGTCQDKSCMHQHFHNTAINDGELLKDLGTRNAPWKTEEEKIRWNNGLSEVVKQLRNSNQGTDVNAIAARIAQYRRDFIGTPDQILNLNPASAAQ